MTETFPLHASGAHLGADVAPLADLGSAQTRFEKRDDGQVLLRGSRSPATGAVFFPVREFSLEGGARDLQPVSFGPGGTLYSFSTVHVSSVRATPYTIGYVDFPNGARVLAEVRDAGPALACDMDVELRADGDEWFVVPTASTGVAA